jgi:hypothetical protein
MSVRVLLCPALADLCEDVCTQCSQTPPGAALAGETPAVTRESPSATRSSANAAQPITAMHKRLVKLPLPRGTRCEFLLLLQAIENLLPAEEADDWLKQPNVDLGGRSPLGCIDARDYAPVFGALFLLEGVQPAAAS